MQAEATSYCVQQPVYPATYEPMWDRYTASTNYNYAEENCFNDFAATSTEFANDVLNDNLMTGYASDNLVSRDFNFSQIQKYDDTSPQGLQQFSPRDYVYPIPQHHRYINQPAGFTRNSDFQSFSDSDSGINSPESLTSPYNDGTSWDRRLVKANMQSYLPTDHTSGREPPMPLSDQFISNNYESHFINMDEYSCYSADPSIPPPLYHNVPVDTHRYVDERSMVKMEFMKSIDTWPTSILRSAEPYHHVSNPSSLSSTQIKLTQQKLTKRRTRSKRRRGANKEKNVHLWQFIRDILLEPKYCPSLMKWEDKKEGVFRFVKSDAVAQMWGRKKQNPKMTYEKLSRAMRYYYSRGILERVDGRRLVYKFGPNSYGWNESKEVKDFGKAVSPLSTPKESPSSVTPHIKDVNTYTSCNIESQRSRDSSSDNLSLLPSANVLLSGSSPY